jgi:hypothetical protein
MLDYLASAPVCEPRSVIHINLWSTPEGAGGRARKATS